MSEEKTLVEVKNLKQYFDINMGMFKTKPLKAVDDISMNEISNGSNKSTGNNSSNHSQMIYRPTETTYQKQLPTTSRLQPPPPPKKK